MRRERIHIVSSGPRCGTTLLFEAMKVCFEFDAAPDHEAPICQSRYDLTDSGRILTKYPGEIDLMHWPLILDPGLHVICLIRDPRDMVVSTHGGRPGVYWASLRYWQLFLEHIDRLNQNPRFILLRYEDLVTDPDGSQKSLMARIPSLSKRHLFSAYHQHAIPSRASVAALNGVRAIGPKGIGSWKNHLPRIKQQIQLHGSPSASLIRFDYEVDDSWQRQLENVTPADAATATGEFFNESFSAQRWRRNALAVSRLALERGGLRSDWVLSPFRAIYRYFRSRR